MTQDTSPNRQQNTNTPHTISNPPSYSNSAHSGADLITTLTNIVGSHHILTDPSHTQPYRQGFRFGEGNAIAVVKPGSLIEQWQVLKACVAADVIVITQAANTGLTGGSTPDGNDYDRPIVIVNTLRMDGIQIINEGKQVVCLPGSTLNTLEKKLLDYDREPHSVIGSSCIGASVLGGVCNNSGGALVQRGACLYRDGTLCTTR